MIKLVTRLSICLVALIGLAACASNNDDVVLDQGKTYFEQHQYKAAFEHLYPLAMEGNSDAQYAVGYILYTGKAGIEADRTQGLEWIRKSALQGNPDAVKAWKVIESQNNSSP
jgi:TPR repeat protein